METHVSARPPIGKKAANNNSKKRQSLLNSVVIGHHRSETAKITKGRGYSERWVPDVEHSVGAKISL
jgi:hypothetical protein